MKRISSFLRSLVTASVVMLVFAGSITQTYSQTYTEYEPSYAIWELGVQMGVIEYGAYANAAPSSLIQGFDKAIEMALASGCIPSDGLTQLKGRMQTASSSNSLYADIQTLRGQLSGIIANSCSCVPKTPTPPTPPTDVYPDISGTWYQNGDASQVCTINQNGQSLTFQIAANSSQGYFSSTSVVYASDWNAEATLSSQNQILTWSNQTWTRNPATQPPPPPPPPPTTGGGIIDIAGEDIAANSSYIWVCLSNGVIYQIPANTRQPQVFSNDKIAEHIAVDERNRPWIIDNEQKVWYHNGSAWVNTNSGDCKAICMDPNNRCWVIDYGWMIKHYDEANQKWVALEKVDGKSLKVINENFIYLANAYGDVYLKQSAPWKALSGKLNDLDASNSGKLFGIGTDNKVYEWANGKWVVHDEYGLAKRIALTPSGDVYTIKLK